MIELKQISFQYEKKQILHDLSLHIKKGKITTILGPNGSGKSTLLYVLARLNKPQSGEVTIGCQTIDNMKKKEFAKKVAIVHQKNTAPSDETVLNIVSYGRLPYLKFGYALTKEDDNIINWAMQVTGIEDIAHCKMGSLSGGQAQRVWIAMALAQKTEILLLDEPTTYLDIKYQYEILELMKKLNRELSLTIVVVLHDLSQALSYSDEIIGLKKGKVIFQKTCDSLESSLLEELYDYSLKLIDYQGHKVILNG